MQVDVLALVRAHRKVCNINAPHKHPLNELVPACASFMLVILQTQRQFFCKELTFYLQALQASTLHLSSTVLDLSNSYKII